MEENHAVGSVAVAIGEGGVGGGDSGEGEVGEGGAGGSDVLGNPVAEGANALLGGGTFAGELLGELRCVGLVLGGGE